MSACPECRSWDTKVVDSRKRAADGWVARRRQCLACGTRYTTLEVPMADVVQAQAEEAPHDA